MARKKRRISPSRTVTGVLGSILLVGCAIGFGWLLRSHSTDISRQPVWNIPGLGPTTVSDAQVPQLVAVGITLAYAQQQPTLSQQQAISLSNQLEADAANKAKKTSARYVLLNYPAITTPATHSTFNNVPVWIIWYQQVPDAAVDPMPSSRSSHDLYVFLDANSGKELLSIWD
jgi:hypothetical protein